VTGCQLFLSNVHWYWLFAVDCWLSVIHWYSVVGCLVVGCLVVGCLIVGCLLLLTHCWLVLDWCWFVGCRFFVDIGAATVGWLLLLVVPWYCY
jgi:hypothetical protein